MGLFSRRSKDKERSGPPPAEMRGRAGEIDDPSPLEWEVVWEALKTEAPDDSSSALTQELGLGEERELSQTTTHFPATEFSGSRNGREVALRMGVVPSVWRDRGANEVQVRAAVAPFQVREDDGRLVAEPGAPPRSKTSWPASRRMPTSGVISRSREARKASSRAARSR